MSHECFEPDRAPQVRLCKKHSNNEWFRATDFIYAPGTPGSYWEPPDSPEVEVEQLYQERGDGTFRRLDDKEMEAILECEECYEIIFQDLEADRQFRREELIIDQA